MNVNHLEKCGLSSGFQYDFRSPQLTADLLTFVSGRIARALLVGLGLLKLWHVSKAFKKVCYAGLLHKLRSYGVSCQIFELILSFLSNSWFSRGSEWAF